MDCQTQGDICNQGCNNTYDVAGIKTAGGNNDQHHDKSCDVNSNDDIENDPGILGAKVFFESQQQKKDDLYGIEDAFDDNKAGHRSVDHIHYDYHKVD